MNFHSDEFIMNGVREHYNEALKSFPEDRIVCIVLQGSQNYGLETMYSDIDTKLILTPTFEDIAMNRQPISTTYVRADNSHTDWKDIRLMLQTFRKCNLNFLEILFSPYVAQLIQYHMRPYLAWEQSEKAMKKDRKLLEEELFQEICLLNKADKYAH